MINKRSYHQYCPIAYSLDLVGDRWTPLILRELLYGPRRYADLQRGLKGIASNLLAARLKDLETTTIIRQRNIPPPINVSVYELTEYGLSTKIILDALTLWGLHLMQQGSLQEDFLSVVCTMHSMNVLFDARAAANVEMVARIDTHGEVIAVHIRDRKILTQSEPPEIADIVMQADAKSILMLLVDGTTVETALREQWLSIEHGDHTIAEQFFGLFSFPETDVSKL